MYFYPNCTLPAHDVSYVGSSNVRSTLDILWTSLATIIACTYSVLHLNVPEQRDGRDPGWKGDIQWGTRRLLTSVKWTIITILGPEYLLAKSWTELRNAKRQLQLLRSSLPRRNNTWSLTHMLFADMGGFVLRYRNGDSHAGPSPEEETTAIKAELNGTDPMPSSIWHLDAYTLLRAIQENLLPSTIMPAEEIFDRSKSDLFTKVITVCQIMYFVVASPGPRWR